MGASLWLDEILYYHFERVPAVRAIEVGRPGSFWPLLMGTFAYCDLQRAVHALFDVSGLHLWTNPELYLRLPSLAYLAVSVIAVYLLGVRAGGDRLWAFGVALAFGSTPIFLFYAFEARVYSLASLLVIAFLGALAAVLNGARGWILAAGAVLGVVVTWPLLWNACLLAAVGLCLPLIVWRDSEHWRTAARVALLIGFGLTLVLAQAMYFFSLRAPGQHGLPLLDPHPLRGVFLSTVYGPFLGLLRGDPEYVLGALLLMSLFLARGRLGWCLPASVGLALALSVILIANFGLGLSPRHQTALYAGIFVCLALTKSRLIGKALLANLIGVNLVLLPETVAKIQAKGNAKQISEVIGSGERLRRIPVVVQHSYQLGYADPLHSFALALYLDGLEPTRSETPILELPTHRDVRNVLIDHDYFANATRRLDVFTAAPVDQWAAFLRTLPDKALWLVAPTNSPAGVRQERQYESALMQAGFSKVPGFPREFYGYPSTKLILWKRTERPR